LGDSAAVCPRGRKGVRHERRIPVLPCPLRNGRECSLDRDDVDFRKWPDADFAK